jgi:hypothetical protein
VNLEIILRDFLVDILRGLAHIFLSSVADKYIGTSNGFDPEYAEKLFGLFQIHGMDQG